MEGNKGNRSGKMRRWRVVMLYMILFISIALSFLIIPYICSEMINSLMLKDILQPLLELISISVLIGCIMGLAETPEISKGVVEKAKQIASSKNYVAVRYCGKENMLMFLYSNALKEYKCTIATRLDEKGQVYYAIIDENGDVVGRECLQRQPTFLIRNFEKV